MIRGAEEIWINGRILGLLPAGETPAGDPSAASLALSRLIAGVLAGLGVVRDLAFGLRPPGLKMLRLEAPRLALAKAVERLGLANT
jgi:hypothetical protein